MKIENYLLSGGRNICSINISILNASKIIQRIDLMMIVLLKYISAQFKRPLQVNFDIFCLAGELWDKEIARQHTAGQIENSDR